VTAYVIRRLWQMIPTLAGVILLIFFLFNWVGGDPAEVLAGKISNPEQIANIRKQLGVDQPYWYQLWVFVQQVFTFDFGRSWSTNEEVSRILLTRVGPTLTTKKGAVLVVTGKQLIAAVAGEHHFDAAGCQLGHPIGGQKRDIAMGLVALPNGLGPESEHVGRHPLTGVVGAKARRGRRRKRALVIGGLVKADRIGAHRRFEVAGHEPHHAARIDTP